MFSREFGLGFSCDSVLASFLNSPRNALTFILVMKAVWPTWLALAVLGFRFLLPMAPGTPITQHIEYSSSLASIRISR